MMALFGPRFINNTSNICGAASLQVGKLFEKNAGYCCTCQWKEIVKHIECSDGLTECE